jgi:dihydroorotate dehydrogenase (NAD+) catalytic subunit
MLNSIGLQNPGVEAFVSRDLAWLAQNAPRTPVVVNVSGHTRDEYAAVVERLERESAVAAYEINISCPNVDAGGMAFGTDCASAAAVTRACRAVTCRTLIVKLSPNVTDVAEIARAVEAEGADAVSLINTLLGMAVDAEFRRPKLARVVGGLSGPAIKPIALRMVWQVASALSVPVIGMGGIANGTDAVEFMLAGATAVAVGTANFVDPTATIRVTDGIAEYCGRHGVARASDLIGALQT